VNADSACTRPTYTTGRVAAVTQRAIVVADTANPSGGFTDEEYRSFGVAFDTLAYPVNVDNFGRETDIDNNGKVIIFYTRAVNQLTRPESEGFVGGFFYGRDLFPRAAIPAQNYQGCEGSNEAEMFYMRVPEPGRQNFEKEDVQRGTIATIGHEFQHLINFGRRVYVNNATRGEEVWLNEGLSHIAEELMFYQVSKLAPRQNINRTTALTEPIRSVWIAYQSQNFGRLNVYVKNPEENSPYNANDNLATRGAIWQFLRYAADRRGGSEREMWMRLVNSTTGGLENLRNVLGTDPVPWFRDWAISVYTDDAVAGVDARFVQPSWNYRLILPAFVSNEGAFPLRTRQLTNSAPVSFSIINRGGTAFLRFGVAANGRAEIRTTSGGATPPAHLLVSVVRTR
jgi:hypothetical protein